MNSSATKYFANNYSHIYIEDEALSYPMTQDILKHFPESRIIRIRHYKDMFNRAKQDFVMQKHAQSLILAVNHSELIYPGARFCQSFGNEHFYYTSNIMNCIYDCEYCYLQGMYPSGNMVIFVNIEDYFSRIRELLKKHPMYICISYDTDLLAMEGLCGFTQKWIDFTIDNPDLTIEVRTKSMYDITRLKGSSHPDIVWAWTLSPDEVVCYEHFTPSLTSRLNAIRKALELDCRVRLCFDPMILIPDYKSIYGSFYKYVFEQLDASKIYDVSIGLFRISADYLKSMRRKRACAITAYPYENINGMCSYDTKKTGEMLDFAESELSKYYPSDRIYKI